MVKECNMTQIQCYKWSQIKVDISIHTLSTLVGRI